MYGWNILCGISKVLFEIPHNLKKYLADTVRNQIQQI